MASFASTRLSTIVDTGCLLSTIVDIAVEPRPPARQTVHTRRGGEQGDPCGWGIEDPPEPRWTRGAALSRSRSPPRESAQTPLELANPTLLPDMARRVR
jgi:hypothetical protein